MPQLIALLFFVLSAQLQAQTPTYTINKDHSQIVFHVAYLKFSTIQGSILDFRGQAQIDENFVPQNIELSLNAQSLTTYDIKRDHHLKKEDFLWVSNFPLILFESKSITPKEASGPDEMTYLIDGVLHFQDRQYPQQFIARFLGKETDPWDKISLFYEFKGELSRSQLGLNWNKLLESGEVLVGDKIHIEGRFQFQDPKNITPFSTHMIPGPRAGSVLPADLPSDQNIDLSFDEPQDIQPRERVYEKPKSVPTLTIAHLSTLLIMAILAFIGVLAIGLSIRQYAHKKAPHIKGVAHLGDLALVMMIFGYAVLIGQLFRR